MRVLRWFVSPVVSSLASTLDITEGGLHVVVDYADGVTGKAPQLSPTKNYTAQ